MSSLLIIEDEPDWRELLRRHLFEYLTPATRPEIATAGTLAEGKRMAEENKYSAIILDLNLPDSPINATLDALPDLAEKWPPTIGITAHDSNSAAVHYKVMTGGGNDYITKQRINAEPREFARIVFNTILRCENCKRKGGCHAG